MTTNGMTTNNQPATIDLRSLTTLIFDLDGVVWRGNEPIEGAAASIARLREAGKRCLYCTNNSKATQKQFADKLRNMGVELEDDDVVTSSIATAMYLSAQFTGPFLVYVIGEEGIVTALQKIGAHVVADNDVTDDTQVDCVVVGIDRAFNYEKLRIAQRLIHKGANFIATNRDNTYPTENGIVPGAGSIVSSVEAASGVTPVTIGKPRPAMVQLVINKLGVAPQEVAMIGDRLDTDIACARRAGIAALFVATGVTPMQQARRGKGELRADAFFEDLPTLSGALLSDEPYQPAAVAAPAASVVQGTASGLQNATDVQPDAGPIELSPTAQTADWSTPDAPPAPATDAIFSEEPATTDASPDETIVWEDEPADVTPALDDAATPGMAEVTTSDVTVETGSDADAVENWDDTWFETEPATDVESVAGVEQSVVQADTAAPFDLNFDKSSPDSMATADTVGAASVDVPAPDAARLDATQPGATQSGDDAQTDKDGFNWKLD